MRLLKTRMAVLLSLAALVSLAAWFANFSAPSAEGSAVPEKYQDMLDKGYEYLVKNQQQDGHWEGDGGKHPVAMTGLAGLALVMQAPRDSADGFGGTWQRSLKYKESVRRAVDWLIDKHQAKSGLIFSGHASETDRYMEGHALALIFLSGAYEAERDKQRRDKIYQVIELGVHYAVRAQSTGGGWYHTSKAEGHDLSALTPTALQIQALQSAENCAGVANTRQAIELGLDYLTTMLAKGKKKKGEISARVQHIAVTLACLRTGQSLLFDGEVSKLPYQEWARFCEAELPMGKNIKFGRDELTHYFYSHATLRRGSYTEETAAHLHDKQNVDGSWPAADNISVGPVCSTALWTIVLQAGRRHPAWVTILINT